MPIAEIQGDAAFTAFQAKLATVVVSARARGVRISADMDRPACRCPLGAHPDSTLSYPPSPVAQREGWAELSDEQLSDFINGFGGSRLGSGSKYHELGQLYRQEFP